MRLLLAAVVAAAGLAVPLPAQAAEAGTPARTVLRLSSTAAAPGERVVLAGRGFARRTALRVNLGGRRVARSRTGRRGRFRIAFRVPRLAPGRYRLRARAGRRRARIGFRVVTWPVPPPRPRPKQPGSQPPAPAPITAAAAPPAGPTLVAAGDIACQPGLPETDTQCRHARTAALAESLAPDAVAVLGDNQYEEGELANFQAAYDPTWGRLKSITHPAPGNHEYEGDDERDAAPGYFAYFGAAAGDPSQGYYRWQLGAWHIFALNSGAIRPDGCWPVSCAEGSPQETWLRSQLETLPAGSCVLAYWHHPRFSSGLGGAYRPHPQTEPLFDALYDHGAALVLTGHSHNYERFPPSDADGTPDPEGVTQFVVGTGGRSLHSNTGSPPLTTTLRTDVFGVLELTLAPDGWTSRFLAEDGSTVDQAGGTC
jgi:hypothetical protein